jgi:hypothetical protein
MAATGVAAEVAEPRVVPVAIDEEIGADVVLHREEGDVGNPVLRMLAEIGQRIEVEPRAADRRHVEADRDGVVGADHPAAHAHALGQGRLEPRGENHEPRAERLPLGEGQGGGIRRRRHGRHLVDDALDRRRHALPEGGHQLRVVEAVLGPRAALDQVALARDPDRVVALALSGDGVEEARPPQRPDMGGLELLAAELRTDLAGGVDQAHAMAGAPEHGGGERTAGSGAYDRDIEISHDGLLRADLFPRNPVYRALLNATFLRARSRRQP